MEIPKHHLNYKQFLNNRRPPRPSPAQGHPGRQTEKPTLPASLGQGLANLMPTPPCSPTSAPRAWCGVSLFPLRLKAWPLPHDEPGSEGGQCASGASWAPWSMNLPLTGAMGPASLPGSLTAPRSLALRTHAAQVGCSWRQVSEPTGDPGNHFETPSSWVAEGTHI